MSETSPFCQVRKVFLVYFSINRDMNAIYHVSLTFRVIFWTLLSPRKARSEKQDNNVQKSETRKVKET